MRGTSVPSAIWQGHARQNVASMLHGWVLITSSESSGRVEATSRRASKALPYTNDFSGPGLPHAADLRPPSQLLDDAPLLLLVVQRLVPFSLPRPRPPFTITTTTEHRSFRPCYRCRPSTLVIRRVARKPRVTRSNDANPPVTVICSPTPHSVPRLRRCLRLPGPFGLAHRHFYGRPWLCPRDGRRGDATAPAALLLGFLFLFAATGF